jgi:hypothetical protein
MTRMELPTSTDPAELGIMPSVILRTMAPLAVVGPDLDDTIEPDNGDQRE